MTPFEITADRMERQKAQVTWAKKVGKLKISQNRFCEKYGFNKSVFSRWLNCKLIASWDYIDKVTDAFEKEGIK